MQSQTAVLALMSTCCAGQGSRVLFEENFENGASGWTRTKITNTAALGTFLGPFNEDLLQHIDRYFLFLA